MCLSVIGIWISFVCGFITCIAQDIIFRHDDDTDFVRRNFVEHPKIPEKLLIEMKDIHNVTDFITRFLTLNNSITTISEDDFLIMNISGKNAFHGVPRAPPLFTQPAICQPEEHIIELEKPGNSAVMLWPSCVRVRRCGGCCTSKMLTCNPVATSSIDVVVLQVRYNPLSPNLFEDQGTRSFTLEQHDRCTCGCKEQPIDCIPGVHEYNENECRCVCVNQEESLTCKGPKTIWDSTDCSCKCRQILQCSTGRYYNIKNCRCEIQRSSLNVDNLEYNRAAKNSTF